MQEIPSIKTERVRWNGESDKGTMGSVLVFGSSRGCSLIKNGLWWSDVEINKGFSVESSVAVPGNRAAEDKRNPNTLLPCYRTQAFCGSKSGATGNSDLTTVIRRISSSGQ